MQELPVEAYRFAVEHTVDSVVITSLDSVIEYVNPAFTRITGFSRDEVLGKKPSVLRSEYTSEGTYKKMWSVILSGGWWRGEIINVRKSGEKWYSALSISQIKDAEGVPIAYIGISRDITDLKRLQMRLKEASVEAIYMLSAASEAKDEVTGSHVQRVRHFSEAIADKLGMSKEKAEEVGYSSMMHDVGKINVPDAVLKKPGPLSDEEWRLMLRHPLEGVSILRDMPFYDVARQIAGGHHEKWDGSGYPTGVKGSHIPLPARIVAVADVFDALTTARPYKSPWPENEAVEEIKRLAGRALDPDVVEVFLSLYEEGVISKIRQEFPDTQE